MELLLSEDWQEKTIKEKTSWLNGYDFEGEPVGTLQRNQISGVELFCGMLQRKNRGLPEN